MRFTVSQFHPQNSPSSASEDTDGSPSRSVDSGNVSECCPGVRRSSDEPQSADERCSLLEPSVEAELHHEQCAGSAEQHLDDDDDYDGCISEQEPTAEVAGGDETVRDRRVLETLVDRGRRFAARQTRRLVHKDGTCNIVSQNVTERRRRYLVDIFTTLVDMRWRYNIVMFGAAFIVSWTTFAVIWFIIAYTHGDCQLADHGEDWQPCISNVYDFSTALLFSMETQTTIGYGFRVVQPQCPVSFFVLVLQSCVGVFIQSLMTGLIFCKISRPKHRAHTIMFSRLAVVCKRDCEYQLLFRVGNMRRSHIIATSIRAIMVKDRLTKEGETIPLCQYPLELETQSCDSNGFLFLVWPVTVVHKITSSSPLWHVSAERMLSEHFEIIVILEGIVESTGMTTQMRTSYLPTEILWGHRLAPLLTFQKDNGKYRIDYKRFHAVETISMPDCSAKSFSESETGQRHLDDDEEEAVVTDFSAAATLLSAAKSSSRPGLAPRLTLSGTSSVMRRVRSNLRLMRRHSQRSSTTNQARDTNHVIDVDDFSPDPEGKATGPLPLNDSESHRSIDTNDYNTELMSGRRYTAPTQV